MILESNEKEYLERERQIQLIRLYNQKKRRNYNERLAKFLRLYPKQEKFSDYGLEKFYRVVNEADFDKLNNLIVLFNKENMYWNSYYVMRRCSNENYQHIITVLGKMHDVLAERLEYLSWKESEIQSVEENDNTNSINQWGKQGEEEVDYVLKWLPDDYIAIKKDCSNKYGNNSIVLSNQNFIDEKQEYDHIVIGPQGIFLIETKNYSGKLYIDSAGNWLRMKKGENEWVAENNPVQQTLRHHLLMESIVGTQIPIIDVVCLANPNLIVSGQENSRIPVVKKDLLGDFIMNYQQIKLTKDDIKALATEIEKYKEY